MLGHVRHSIRYQLGGRRGRLDRAEHIQESLAEISDFLKDHGDTGEWASFQAVREAARLHRDRQALLNGDGSAV